LSNCEVVNCLMLVVFFMASSDRISIGRES